MKKRLLCWFLVLLLLTGCANDSSRILATGEYNEQTITMTYQVTDVIYPHDMRSIPIVNGYARIYDYNSRTTNVDGNIHNSHSGDTWNVVDLHGNLLFDEPYLDVTHFNTKGVAAAKNYDGTFVQITTDGKETYITEQAYQDFVDDSGNIAKKYVSAYPNESADKCSTVWDGLALYLEETEDNDNWNFLVGLADVEGNVIIPAFIPIHCAYYTEHLYLNEDVSIVEDAATGHIGIITITRS